MTDNSLFLEHGGTVYILSPVSGWDVCVGHLHSGVLAVPSVLLQGQAVRPVSDLGQAVFHVLLIN